MNLGALFDWDGVIIDSSVQHKQAWEDLARELGKPLSEDHFERSFGMKNQFIIPDIYRWTQDPEEIELWSLRKEEIYRKILASTGISPLPGIIDLLTMLNEHGVPCAVGSSTPRKNIETVFELIALRDHFTTVISADDVSKGKPDPEVFQKSARAIGLEPSHCVVFEDAHVGIEAGLAAGSKVIAVATTNEIGELGKADVAVQSLEEVDWLLFSGLF